MNWAARLDAFQTVFWFAAGAQNPLQRGPREHLLRVWYLSLQRRQGEST